MNHIINHAGLNNNDSKQNIPFCGNNMHANICDVSNMEIGDDHLSQEIRLALTPM